MSAFNVSVIILRRIVYSDYDVILDCLTGDGVKLTAIAKNARKSKKRFAGALELFSCLDTVLVKPKRPGNRMFILKEAALIHPFAGIRGDIEKMVYASYWSEIINRWMEEGGRQIGIFPLFHYALSALDRQGAVCEQLSLLFQIRFLALTGISPDLLFCVLCRTGIDSGPGNNNGILFDIARGGLVCPRCRSRAIGHRQLVLSPGTIKPLLWMQAVDLQQAGRVHCSTAARREGLKALEGFITYHLTAEIKSLKVLRNIRKWRQTQR